MVMLSPNEYMAIYCTNGLNSITKSISILILLSRRNTSCGAVPSHILVLYLWTKT
ncbi:hypothetical protein HMPREF1870_00595 [Bacteroidales bacterium KA00344]|nr:hypothetical protein HMPREF1870_00595 [Bacteroidales bacterium KA00344]